MPRSSAGIKRAKTSDPSAGAQRLQERTPISTGEIRQLHSRIAVRAFEIYEKRGKKHGHDLDDWFRAEHEVLGEGMGSGLG